MAKNDLKPNQPDHVSSSDDEEDEEEASGSGSEDGSDSDEASDTDSGEKPKPEPKQALTPPPVQIAIKPNPADLSTSYESEESDSGSDSDADSDLPPKKSSAAVSSAVKPVSSVPMERVGRNLDSKLVKKDGSKTVVTPSPAKSKRPLPAPAPVEKDAKKAKQNPANRVVKIAVGSSSQSVNNSQASAPDLSVSEIEETESGSETDTDSDSPPVRPIKSASADPNVKPISKPMEKQIVSKTVLTPPPVKSMAKSKPLPAPALVTCEKDRKDKDVKIGKKSGGRDEDSKKQLFQRLWSEDDEIVMLEGMIEYKNETGVNPIADMGAFHEFIKKSLHVEVTRAQLGDKVRRLKKKYVNNASREKDGKDRSFAKSHERKGYELSKLIWGGNSNSNTGGIESKKNQSQKNGKLKVTVASTSTGTGTGSAGSLLTSNGVGDKDKVMIGAEKTLDISRFVRYGGMSDSLVSSEEVVKAGLELVDGSKRAELEAKWRKLKEQELELYVKRMELLREQALVVLEAVRSSRN